MHEFTDTEAFLHAITTGIRLTDTAPYVIAIDGRSGAGKTTLAARLSDRLTAAALAHDIFHMEDLYQGWGGLATGVAQWKRNALALASGTPMVYYGWDWRDSTPTGPHVQKVAPATVLICEGVGAAQGKADISCWIELPTPARKKRALARDGQLFRPYWEMWAAQEERQLATGPLAGKINLLLHASEDSAQPPPHR